MGLRKWAGKYTRLIAMQSDITKMYTNLHHQQIIDAIIWMIGRAQKTHKANKKKTRTQDEFILLAKNKRSAR